MDMCYIYSMFKRIVNPGNLLSLLLPALAIWGGYFIYISIHECIGFFLPVIYFCLAGFGSIVYLYKRNRYNLSGMLPPELPAIVGMILCQPLYFLVIKSVFGLHIHTADYEFIRQYLAIPVSTLRIAALDGTLFALPLTLLLMYLTGLWLRHKQQIGIIADSEDRKPSMLRIFVRALMVLGYLGAVFLMLKGVGGPEVRVMNSYETADAEFDWGTVHFSIIDSYGFPSIIETPVDGEESPVATNHLAGFIFIFQLNGIDKGRISVSNIRLFEVDGGREVSLQKVRDKPDILVDRYFNLYGGMSKNGTFHMDHKQRGNTLLIISDAFPSNKHDLEVRFNFRLETDAFVVKREITIPTARGLPGYLRFPGIFRVLSARQEKSSNDCLALDY